MGALVWPRYVASILRPDLAISLKPAGATPREPTTRATDVHFLLLRNLFENASFTHSIQNITQAKTIATAVIQLPHLLGMTVVCESVETAERHQAPDGPGLRFRPQLLLRAANAGPRASAD